MRRSSGPLTCMALLCHPTGNGVGKQAIDQKTSDRGSCFHYSPGRTAQLVRGGRWQGPQAAQLQRSTHHPHCTQSRPQGQRRAAANRPAGCGVRPFDDCTQQGAASAGSRPRAGSLANGTGAAHRLEACTVRGQGRWPAPGETPTRRERQAQRRADRQQRRAGGAPAGGSQTGSRALQQRAGVRAGADRARLRRMGCELRTAQRSA